MQEAKQARAAWQEQRRRLRQALAQVDQEIAQAQQALDEIASRLAALAPDERQAA